MSDPIMMERSDQQTFCQSFSVDESVELCDLSLQFSDISFSCLIGSASGGSDNLGRTPVKDLTGFPPQHCRSKRASSFERNLLARGSRHCVWLEERVEPLACEKGRDATNQDAIALAGQEHPGGA